MNTDDSEQIIKVLLVEDSPTAAQLVAIYLKRGLPQHKVTTVSSVGEAMSEMRTTQFDIVLLDLNLPDSTGLSTFITVQAHPGDTPVIILSGDGDENLAVEAVRQGAQDYLVKANFDDAHLSRSIRFALERSRRIHFEQEVSGARAIQQKLYPLESPDLPEFDIAGAAFAAEHVSGDYFDYIPMSNGRLGIVVGDVSGHGLGPALLMAETRAYLHALTLNLGSKGQFFETEDLGLVLSRTNQLLLVTPGWMFVTLFFLCLSPQKKTYTYSSAGHRVLHIAADGSVMQRSSTGPALGIMNDADFEMEGPFPIEPGDTIFLGTDGFEESEFNGELFGVDRVVSTIMEQPQSSSMDAISQLTTTIEQFRGNAAQADDMTAIIIRRKDGKSA